MARQGICAPARGEFRSGSIANGPPRHCLSAEVPGRDAAAVPNAATPSTGFQVVCSPGIRRLAFVAVHGPSASEIFKYVPPDAVRELERAEVSGEGFWHGRES